MPLPLITCLLFTGEAQRATCATRTSALQRDAVARATLARRCAACAISACREEDADDITPLMLLLLDAAIYDCYATIRQLELTHAMIFSMFRYYDID